VRSITLAKEAHTLQESPFGYAAGNEGNLIARRKVARCVDPAWIRDTHAGYTFF
jgi:hypothetical protein